MKATLSKLKEFIMDEKASPLLEEGILLGLSMLTLAVIAAILGNFISWFKNAFSSLWQTLSDLQKSFLDFLNEGELLT
ncbi:hypothetical protein DRO02_03120 [archaeon]|nr:MAG: hypothetical protein DRO02_03120 [archaeon]RLG65240.1 MAG: hypothetical protein DRO21_02430 [archaeon]RLG66478.1 MAG: hypothetical protein DRN89_00800 [archaeon]HDM24291.1 hypothetical protein [Candidatus Bathyarchaeota archaeon]